MSHLIIDVSSNHDMILGWWNEKFEHLIIDVSSNHDMILGWWNEKFQYINDQMGMGWWIIQVVELWEFSVLISYQSLVLVNHKVQTFQNLYHPEILRHLDIYAQRTVMAKDSRREKFEW
jgi:hypothetical protein